MTFSFVRGSIRLIASFEMGLLTTCSRFLQHLKSLLVLVADHICPHSMLTWQYCSVLNKEQGINSWSLSGICILTSNDVVWNWYEALCWDAKRSWKEAYWLGWDGPWWGSLSQRDITPNPWTNLGDARALWGRAGRGKMGRSRSTRGPPFHQLLPHQEGSTRQRWNCLTKDSPSSNNMDYREMGWANTHPLTPKVA